MNKKPAWHKIKYFLTIVVNIILLYALAGWFAQNMHLSTLLYNVSQVHCISLLMVVLLNLVVSFLYGFRLKRLLNLPFSQTWKLVCIGNGLNNILPFRLGDVARIYCARQYYHLQINETIAVTFVERYADLVLLLTAGSLFLLFGKDNLDPSFLVLFMVFLACALFSIFIYRRLIVRDGKARQWLHHVPLIPAIVDQLVNVVSIKKMWPVLLFSAGIWGGTVMIYHSFFSINLPNTEFSFLQATILCFMTTLAFAVPYVVAGIGVFESAIFYYLTHFIHVPTSEAVALALVFHLAFAVPQILLMCGIFAYRKLNNLWPSLSKRLGSL